MHLVTGYRDLVYLLKYQISKVFIALMYKKHTHMVYGELHILPYLVLDQNANDNAYSSPLRHEVWNVDHKIVMLGIYFLLNYIFTYLSSTECIILNMILSFCPFSFHESFSWFSLIALLPDDLWINELKSHLCSQCQCEF